MGQIATKDAQLNAALLNGTVLEVFGDIYHPDVVMIEGDGTECAGLAANTTREQQFFGSITEFKAGNVTDAVVDEENGVSYNTQFMHVMMGEHELKLDQVAVRHWKDGKIIRERFYYNA